MKPVEREEARRLRREEGLALRVIAGRLDVSVGSVSLWTRDIELSDAQHERLRQANPIYNQQLRGQAGRSASALAATLAAQAHGRALARQGDPLHMMGCMLHWAEGSKARNRIVFTNSDPEMLRAFLRFLRGPCSVRDESIYGAIQEYGGFDRPEWLD